MPIVPFPARLQRLCRAVIMLLMPIVLVIGVVRIVVSDQYLAFEYGKVDFPADRFGLTTGQRVAYATANFRYVRAGQPLAALANQALDGQPAYNARELKHMLDVQNVYQTCWRVWQLALILLALLIFTLAWREETRPLLASALKWSGLLSAGFVGAIGFLGVVAWQAWFVGFHQIFFSPGTWSFEYSDTLIRLFPERFWFDAALTIAGLSTAGGLLVSGLGWLLGRPPYGIAARAGAQPSRS